MERTQDGDIVAQYEKAQELWFATGHGPVFVQLGDEVVEHSSTWGSPRRVGRHVTPAEVEASRRLFAAQLGLTYEELEYTSRPIGVI